MFSVSYKPNFHIKFSLKSVTLNRVKGGGKQYLKGDKQHLNGGDKQHFKGSDKQYFKEVINST